MLVLRDPVALGSTEGANISPAIDFLLKRDKLPDQRPCLLGVDVPARGNHGACAGPSVRFARSLQDDKSKLQGEAAHDVPRTASLRLAHRCEATLHTRCSR